MRPTKYSKPQIKVHCYLQLKLFGKQQTVDLLLEVQHRNDVISCNEEVKKNRLIVRGFIDAVCYLANKIFPSTALMGRPHIETRKFREISQCVENS